MTAARLLLAIAGLATAFMGYPGTPAQAQPSCAGFTLSCEDGRAYSFCPTAISDVGDIVAANLTAQSRSWTAHLRLVPMGVGYRYVGHQIWLDGDYGQAVLNFGKHHAVACAISGD